MVSPETCANARPDPNLLVAQIGKHLIAPPFNKDERAKGGIDVKAHLTARPNARRMGV
jgi:hypothetical protein